MSVTNGFGDKVSFIWAVADELRGDFKAHEYGQVILPFLVLRRLECALEPTKAVVIAKAESLKGKVDNVDPILQMTAKHKFYNTSPLDLTKLLSDSKMVAANLRTYVQGFSPGAVEVLDKYNFDDKITRLENAGLLYRVVSKFAELDLSTGAVSNDAMGYIFEELLRRFSEMSNETAGEHFTPREVIRLMVNILFVEDDKALSGAKPIRTLYDPACGTGGMLTVAQEHVHELNANAVLEAYGQELNDETWAICRSDLMIKGQDPERIAPGNSLTGDDGHAGERFDYMLANPPFGVDWKKYAKDIQIEAATKGFEGRYGAGLPRVSDGSMLFLQHMISKMKPVADDLATPDIIEGGTRLAIVFSGSPLFSGAAGGGESDIRRWIIENDWLEGIVALPDQLFYNTGISTYFWVLTNRKPAHRVGKIALVAARDAGAKMRKSLGDKRKYLTDADIETVTHLYGDSIELAESGDEKRVKVFPREAFGYQRVTVEQPLRRRWELTSDTIDALRHEKAWIAWATPPKNHAEPADYIHGIEASQEKLVATLHDKSANSYATEIDFKKALTTTIEATCIDVPANVTKTIVKNAATPDPDAPIITNKKGKPEPDPDLRDQENIPLPDGYLTLDPEQRDEALVTQANQYLADEIHPYLADAWIDHSKTKIGYEIPFTRHFYQYVPPRPVAEIDVELDAIEHEIQQLLGGLKR